LGHKRITDVHLGDLVEKEVAVLFTDIRDYTRLSEGMSPEDNFRFVSAYNARLGPIVQKHGGFVNQYLGDAIMAIFPESTAEAVSAAVEMEQVLADYNRRRKGKGRQAIRTGTGIHTGSLIMGILGDDKRLDAATISDTVNTSARIEELTKHFGAGILLSLTSYLKSGMADKNGADQLSIPGTDVPLPSSGFRYLGQVLVKGKKEPIGLMECLAGEEDEVKIKESTLASFHRALLHYLEGDFAKAITLFREVIEQDPEDKAARLFLDRSAKFVTSGVPKDWSGVEKAY
ncbi:MAG: adenylate/guanylate cyclase domain-containing protein, partial [Saprospiraceae bacterium]|nr:adenylate/guanylate cyclase domain-containing protein [Saprospiraceae bacterium]